MHKRAAEMKGMGATRSQPLPHEVGTQPHVQHPQTHPSLEVLNTPTAAAAQSRALANKITWKHKTLKLPLAHKRVAVT